MDERTGSLHLYRNRISEISSVDGQLCALKILADHASLAVTRRYIAGNGEARAKVMDLV